MVRIINARHPKLKRRSPLKLCLLVRRQPIQKRWTVFIQRVNFAENSASEGVRRGRTESANKRVESAEHGVGASVSVPDFHRGCLGSVDPGVQDSGLSNS